MAAKPSQLPQWATDAGRTFEPDSLRKGKGHEAGYRPAARVQNWYQNNVYQWLAYLNDGIMSGAFTFENGITIAPDEHITLQDSGKLKHGAKLRQLPICTGQVTTAGTYDTTNGVPFQLLPLSTGERIISIALTVNRVNAGNTMRFELWRNNAQFDVSTTSTNTSGDQQIVLDLTSYLGSVPVFNGSDVWVIKYTAMSGALTNNYFLSKMHLVFDVP